MSEDQFERLVLAWERIAKALEGLNDTDKKRLAKEYPRRRTVREAVVTRVKNEEDRLREHQGASNQPLNNWLSDIADEEDEEEFIGVREREFKARQRDAGAEASGEAGPNKAGAEALGSKV